MVDLEKELVDLASEIEWPDGDIASQVASRLRAHTTTVPFSTRRRRAWRIAVRVAAAAVITTVAVPASRAAISGWFGVRGDRIEVSATTVPSIATSLPQTTAPPDLQLGPEVALADVRAQVGFTMPVPREPGFEHPDEVHVGHPPASGEATLLYRARVDLPAAGPTGVGMLISAFRADLDPGFFGKVAAPDVQVEQVTVQGGVGYWLEGAPHQFFYRDATGEIVPHTLRLAANVLFWETNGITVRIESALPRDAVIRVADAMA